MPRSRHGRHLDPPGPAGGTPVPRRAGPAVKVALDGGPHLTRQAAALGARMIGVGAEPRAEGFYQRMGMVSQGEFHHNGERLVWMMGETAKVMT